MIKSFQLTKLFNCVQGNFFFIPIVEGNVQNGINCFVKFFRTFCGKEIDDRNAYQTFKNYFNFSH